LQQKKIEQRKTVIIETTPFLALIVNLSASSPPIVQVMSPTLESPVKVGVVGRAIRKISLYNGEDNDPVPTVSPTLESPVKVGVGLVNASFSATLATAMRLILKLALDWELTIALISSTLSFSFR
jgi:hypothetical protein